MEQPKFIPAGNYNKPPLSAEELAVMKRETMDKLIKGNLPEKIEGEDLVNLGAEIREELENESKSKSYKELYNGISDDIGIVDTLVKSYVKYSDARHREVIGVQVMSEYESITSELDQQIEASKKANDNGASYNGFSELKDKLEAHIEKMNNFEKNKKFVVNG